MSLDTGDSNFTVKGTTVVQSDDCIRIIFPGGKTEELNVKIMADFKDIPTDHHEIFLQSFQSRYSTLYTVNRNTEPEPKPEKKRPWWKFWKK